MQQRHDNPVSAIWTAIRENLGRKNAKNLIPGALPSDRLEGRTVMVTGSNSGLGKAVAVELASRGARVIMPCRGGIPEAGQEVRARSGNPQIEMISVDLSDLASVHKLCDTLRDRGERIDILVSNAGVVPKEGRKSAQGFELMVAVNCLAPTVLVDRLLRDGVIPNDTHANNGPAKGAAALAHRVRVERGAPHRDGAGPAGPRALRGLRHPRRHALLRAQQAVPQHLRGGAVAPLEEVGRDARRGGASPVPRAGGHQHGA
ncbi:MAG: SDR family NAD(P)-dependent oxidoreductase [Sandaracinaceae bacterium]|nr:SDR family NAD(P)-dependent oxidoreductase [Sandaracinaceae bacterium]